MASACGKPKPKPDACIRQFFPAVLRSLLLILLLALPATALPATETRVRVTAQKASLRYHNADNDDSACEILAGQELIVLGSHIGNWVPVVPPDDVNVWIYAELVRKGRVARDKSQVRSGPGLNYKVVGSLAQNTAVEQRGRVGDWLKIKPPYGFSLWISRSAIAVVSASTAPTFTTSAYAATTSAAPEMLPLPPAMASGLIDALTNNDAMVPAAAISKASAISAVAEPPPSGLATNIAVRMPPPPALASLQLTDTLLQGRRDRFQGAILPILAGSTQVPAKHRIAGPDRTGGRVTYCYVLTPNAQLDALPYGTKVTIEGPAWWLKGEAVPVIMADTVITDPQ